MRTKEAESLVREARERLTAGWEHDRDNREEGFQDLKMVAGDQWPEYVRQQRESDGRPTITINKLAQFVNQVSNDIRENPPGVNVVPADGATDPQVAETYSGLIRAIQHDSHAPDVYAMAAGHAVACGIGHFRIVTDYESDDVFDQTIGIRRMPFPFSVIWDPEAVMPDRSDAKWCIVTELVHKAVWDARFPGHAPAGFDVPIPGKDPENGLFWRNGEMYRVGEYWYRVPEKKKIVMFEDGSIMDVTDLKKHEFFGLPPVVAERRVDSYHLESAILSANEVLVEPQKWPGRYIPIVPVVGGEIPLDTRIIRFGLVRFARDPQVLYNYARSAAAESIGLAPKAPYLVTAKMIGKYKAQWDSHNTTQRPYLLYEPDDKAPGGRPAREPPPEVPLAFIQEAQIASDDIKGSIGVYDASLGARSNETSGVAITARQREADVTTAHFGGNLNISLIHAGRILIDLIPKVYDSERIVRILGEDETTEEFVPINKMVMADNGAPILLNDLSQGRFAVRLRSGPSYATKRIEAAESMLAFAQAVPQAAAVIGDLIASNMDWPGADEIAERLKRLVPPHILGENGNPQAAAAAAAAAQAQKVQEAMAMLETAAKQAEVEKTKADAEKSRASAEATIIDTLIKALTARAQGLGAVPIPQETGFAMPGGALGAMPGGPPGLSSEAIPGGAGPFAPPAPPVSPATAPDGAGLQPQAPGFPPAGFP